MLRFRWSQSSCSSPKSSRPTLLTFHPQSTANIAAVLGVDKVPIVLELHRIGVPFGAQPWVARVGKPLQAAGQCPELWLQCFKELVKDGVDGVVSRPGRGRKTGRLQIQLLGFVDEPRQMAFTILKERRPMPVGAVVWPVRILSNPVLPYQFITKPGQMQVDASILSMALAGVRGQFNPTFDQALEGLSPEHLMDKLRHIPRFTLLKMLRQNVFLEGVPTSSDQCTWRIGDKNPDDWARAHARQSDPFQLGLFGQEAEAKVFCKRITFSIKTDCRSWRPLTHQPFGEVIDNLAFTLVSHGQCKKDPIVDIGPCSLVQFTLRGIERSLAAGRVGCESRVGHFDRTRKFDTGHNPFGCLALRSYPETLMKHVSQLESIILSKFKSFAPTLIMLMFAIAFEWIQLRKFFEITRNGPAFLHWLAIVSKNTQHTPIKVMHGHGTFNKEFSNHRPSPIFAILGQFKSYQSSFIINFIHKSDKRFEQLGKLFLLLFDSFLAVNGKTIHISPRTTSYTRQWCIKYQCAIMKVTSKVLDLGG